MGGEKGDRGSGKGGGQGDRKGRRVREKERGYQGKGKSKI